jgi:Lon protease-like protein
MPAEIFQLPLFPLHTVLFPQSPVRLHVFEERYRVMINGCILRGDPFGIVLIREGNEVGAPAVPFEVGCLARIVAVNHLQDGRMDLFAIGESRFRVLEYAEADHPYLVGRVETIEDDPGPPESTAAHEQMLRLVKQISEQFTIYVKQIAARAGMELPELDLPSDPAALCFCIASIVQLPTPDKQILLELTDPVERLRKTAELLETLWVTMQDIDQGTPGETQPGEPHIQVLDPSSEYWTKYREQSNN